MTKPKIEVVYHAEPVDSMDPAYRGPSVGIKLTTDDGQFGQWRSLREGHTLQDVLTELATCCVLIACGQADGPLGEVPHDEVMRFLGVAKAAG